jgi:hypothetical protein
VRYLRFYLPFALVPVPAILVAWIMVLVFLPTNQCVDPGFPWPHEVTGWHHEGAELVKCYRGQVIDYADVSR